LDNNIYYDRLQEILQPANPKHKSGKKASVEVGDIGIEKSREAQPLYGPSDEPGGSGKKISLDEPHDDEWVSPITSDDGPPSGQASHDSYRSDPSVTSEADST